MKLYILETIVVALCQMHLIATTSAGIIFDIGRRYEFINNVDYTISIDNAAWTGGISAPHVVITHLLVYWNVEYICYINKEEFHQYLTNLYVGFTITSINP